jgi:hypothetical protein
MALLNVEVFGIARICRIWGYIDVAKPRWALVCENNWRESTRISPGYGGRYPGYRRSSPGATPSSVPWSVGRGFLLGWKTSGLNSIPM